MEWIYYVIAFFWLLSAFNKAKKKQQLEVEKKKQAFRPVGTSAPQAEAKLPYSMATEAEILKAIRTREIGTVGDIIDYTSAGEGCNACHPLLKEYLERERQRAGKPAP